MPRPCLFLLALLSCLLSPPAVRADGPLTAWATAHRQKPMTAAETREFMKRLAGYVFDNHLKQAAKSEQRGMIYEYFAPARKGQFDQFVQGEALDTMHDGAWFAAALVTAYRATGDPYYQEFLTRWSLPFYCQMLNHSDTLFDTKRNDARPGAHTFNKEHALQPGEKGFVPYWWDDGGSVSLERRRDKNPLGAFACTDLLAGKPNPQFLLSGYSHGSSNHLAQDLGVMVQLAGLLLKDSRDEADRKLTAEVAAAAKNLLECRLRHHGHIPMCDAPAALALHDAALLRHVPEQTRPFAPSNHFWRALYDFKPGQRAAFPGFADDQQYNYYHGLARHAGQLPRPMALRTVYDAYTEPLLYRYYSDDAEVPAGVNRFDLHPYYCRDGRPEDYRSDRKGPSGKPRPIGSRMGPQNMICCGWALQVLRAYPGIWDERHQREFAKDVRVDILDETLAADVNRPEAEPLTVDGVTLRLTSTRLALRVRGAAKAEEVTLKVFSRPEGKGTHAVVSIKKDGTVAAVNEQGEKLVCRGEARAADGGLRFDVEVPYTVAKGQKPWANGVEHGRLSLQAGHASRNLFLASREGQVKAWLEHELAGGLRTWEAVFRDKGYIPTGFAAGADWESFSDSGGYAHLLSAAAQWLLYLDGKSDWEQHHVPAVIPR